MVGYRLQVDLAEYIHARLGSKTRIQVAYVLHLTQQCELVGSDGPVSYNAAHKSEIRDFAVVIAVGCGDPSVIDGIAKFQQFGGAERRETRESSLQFRSQSRPTAVLYRRKNHRYWPKHEQGGHQNGAGIDDCGA